MNPRPVCNGVGTHPLKVGVPARAESPGLTQEFEGDADALVDALKAGIRDKVRDRAVRSAQAWIQLIYGRQLQGRADEGDPLDISAMSQEERNTLKARLVKEHPT
jgi:hypothetical protein